MFFELNKMSNVTEDYDMTEDLTSYDDSKKSSSNFSLRDTFNRNVPSFIEAGPPLVTHPFLRPKPRKGKNLLELFEEETFDDDSEHINVYLRIKPCEENDLYQVRSSKELITAAPITGRNRHLQLFEFSHIFQQDSTQEEIFDCIVKNNLKKLSQGLNFTLLTYGVTGSGKTYTLMGTIKEPGLVPRSLEYLFKLVNASASPVYKPTDYGIKKLSSLEQEQEIKIMNEFNKIPLVQKNTKKYRRMSNRLHENFTVSSLDLTSKQNNYIWVSFVEIYNDCIYDLLVNKDRKTAPKLNIREDQNGNAFVKGSKCVFVRSGQEAYDVMVAGKRNLAVAATGVHANSSRSHCIFTITLITDTEEGVRLSCARLCDLAGAERAQRTRNAGARMHESRAINSSLHVLERCIHTALRGQRARTADPHIPYRESKLTRLLGAGLAGRGEALSMVVTVNPAPEFISETRHVLQLASIAKDIAVNTTIAGSVTTLESSRETSYDDELMGLRADNERMRFELDQANQLIENLQNQADKQREENMVTTKELIESSKLILENYYKDVIAVLEKKHQCEIDEIKEEYEERLGKSQLYSKQNVENDSLQKKIKKLKCSKEQLTKEVTALQAELASAKATIDNLKIQIKNMEFAKKRGISVISLDSGEESDNAEEQLNESLEPVFKSRIKRNSNKVSFYDQQIRMKKSISLDIEKNLISGPRNDSTVSDESNRKFKDQKVADNLQNIHFKGDIQKKSEKTQCTEVLVNATDSNSSNNKDSQPIQEVDSLLESNSVVDLSADNGKVDKKFTSIANARESEYEMKEQNLQNTESQDEISLKQNNLNTETMKKKSRETYVVNNNYVINANLTDALKSDNLVSKRDGSLAQFENYEKATKYLDIRSFDTDSATNNLVSKHSQDDNIGLFSNLKTIIGTRKYFDESHITNDNRSKDKEIPVHNDSKSVKCMIEVPDKNTESVVPTKELLTCKSNLTGICNSTVLSPKPNNTIEEFDQLFENVSAVTSSDFDVLISNDKKTKDNKMTNKKLLVIDHQIPESEVNKKNEEKEKENTDSKKEKLRKMKKNLRLKENRFADYDSHENQSQRLKDIINLQKEFSDVTLDVPVKKKEFTDITSPEKQEENAYKINETQSCRNNEKILRSRRKLYTPQESFGYVETTGDSDDKVRIPRPSYHRMKARRKL